MKVRELLTEWSEIPKDIFKHLKNKGYKLLGKGADQAAFLEPSTGKVLKIFGSKLYVKTRYFTSPPQSEYTSSQKMFKFWVEYCEKNRGNPFLPRYDGWERFVLNDTWYFQIRMEYLKNLPLGLAQALHEWAAFIDRKPDDQRINDILDNLQDLNDETNKIGQFLTDAEVRETEKLMILLGQKQFKLLMSTIADLSKIAKSKGYQFDLHGANFMHRNDGIPVIVDPWVVG